MVAHTWTEIRSTCSDSHTDEKKKKKNTHTQPSPWTLKQLHRWCLIWGLHSTSKGHLWHLRLLTNDDAQKSFATTKAEQKNWHEREVNKQKTFNKTLFLPNSLQRFSQFFFPPHDTTNRRTVESHSWTRRVATILWFIIRVGLYC